MSLYHEAGQLLTTATKDGASLKSIAFGKTDWKSDRRTLFALATEASKWSEPLSEVIEKSGLLALEKQLTPTLAVLLTHDLLLSKRGIALPSTHGLHASIVRHKARLTAELTKLRIRRGFATLTALRAYLDQESGGSSNDGGLGPGARQPHPRWIRINALRTSLEEQLDSTFAGYQRTASLRDVCIGRFSVKLLHIDNHIPNLIAVPPKSDIASTAAYKEGKLILQDKASCFPAYLLNPEAEDGDMVDACAAPGNKTAHLAAILSLSENQNRKRKITACEKDEARSGTLLKMVELAGATDVVRVKAKQDFLRMDPNSKEFSNVTGLLLDPSCSGSGIVGRDERTLQLHLPSTQKLEAQATKGKKRKRAPERSKKVIEVEPSAPDDTAAEEPEHLETDGAKLKARLVALASFQLRLLEHAMGFPAAKRIVYSTCSIHEEENEHVVTKALLTDVAQTRGWRILHRAEQVEGMKDWHHRGSILAVRRAAKEIKAIGARLHHGNIAQGCIRCEKGGEDGTMGFFVAGFVRDSGAINAPSDAMVSYGNGRTEDRKGILDEEEWTGFSDTET